MFKTRLSLVLTVAVMATVGLAACDPHVRRQVTLAFTDGIPHAHTMVIGNTLELELGQMEHLRDDLSYVAWARSGGAWIRLGVIEPEDPASFEGTTSGVSSWGEVGELVISEETTASLPESPTGTIHFSGRPGGALRFAGDDGPDASSFHEATAAARIEDETLVLTYAGLPELGFGRSYGVWLLPGDADEEVSAAGDGHDDGHDHQHKRAADVHPAPGQALFLGLLDQTGSSSFKQDVLLATYGHVLVTIEIDNGKVEAALHSVVMRGEIPHEVIGSSSSSGAPEAEGHSH